MESGDLIPGQRFCPMEDELLMFYLSPKVNGLEVPGNEALVCELDLYGNEDPWNIWKRFEEGKANDLRLNKDLYFFTKKKKKTARSSRVSRTVGTGGTWNGRTAGKKVYLLDEDHKKTSTLLGWKKTYTYQNQNKGSIHHGRWIMYEYELDKSQILNKKVNQNEYVLCLLRKNDVLPEKKRKRQEEEDEMVEDYVEDEGDNNNPEPMMMPQEKRQRCLLPSMQDEQEQFLVSDQQFLQTDQPSSEYGQTDPSLEYEQQEPSSEYGQEGAVPSPLEGEPLFTQMDENMGLQTPPMLDEAELQQLFNEEFLRGQIPLEEEPVDVMQMFENSGKQQLEAEPQPREENLGQQCEVPTFYADDIVGCLDDLALDENMVLQMGAEALREVDMYGGNWSPSFMESLMNDELPPTMEVGDSDSAYSDFGYNLEL